MTDRDSLPAKPTGYTELLDDLKGRIHQARTRAALAVNQELVLLYWSIGRDILARQEVEGWGAKVIDQLAQDLRKQFPDMRGLSARNLKYMRNLAHSWPNEPVVQEVLARIPWYHNLALLEKLKDSEQRLWYAKKTVEHGWSRNVLVLQIESRLFERQGSVATNFERTLPPPQSDLVRETLKDPYNFEFLTVAEDAHERAIERGLVHHIRDFLLELGQGFSFMGSQVPLEVGGEQFYVDLLFYHVKLRCYIVLELKAGAFKPEYAGKLNFYLSAIDELMRHPDDQPSIGLVLCRGKNEVVVEYSLRDMAKPLGVSEYQLTEALPEDLIGSLPTVEELEAKLGTLPEEGETE